MIKNIIFDMGNVLMNFTPLDYLNQIIADPAVAEKIYQEMFCKNEWSELDRGAISEDEAVEGICSRIPEYSKYVKQAVTGCFDKIMPIAEMYDLIKELKQQGYHTYLLSNASPRIYEYKSQIPAFQLLDGFLISCDIKVNKPDREIYEALMRKYDLVAAECLFIDDLPQNIAGAKAAGWQGHVFKGEAELRRYLAEQHILG